MALNGLICADVLLSNYSLTHPLTHPPTHLDLLAAVLNYSPAE